MGSTISAIIRIRNLTNSDVTSIFVYDIDSFDFGTLRPDKIFNKMTIPSKNCLEKIIHYSTFSSNCPFTMKLVFKNGLEDVFRINYKCIFDNSDPNFRHLTRSHQINYKKTGPRVVEIIIENTQSQIKNQKAEQLLTSACKLMELGRYSEASVKFLEASQKATKSETLTIIHKESKRLKNLKEIADIDKKAKNLNIQGLKLLTCFRFNEALLKFTEALKLADNCDTIALIEDNLRITKEAKLDSEAKQLNHEGLILRKLNDNIAAIQKFDEALKIAPYSNLIKTNKADVLHREAEIILNEAWFLEITTPKEAIYKFTKARFLFQEADNLRPDLDYQKNLEIIDLKIEATKYFNLGVHLENEASSLIDKTVKSQKSEDCKTAKEKYEEAWKNYKEAQKLFEEGRKIGEIRFERNLELTKEALNGIERILNELEKTELEIALST